MYKVRSALIPRRTYVNDDHKPINKLPAMKFNIRGDLLNMIIPLLTLYIT